MKRRFKLLIALALFILFVLSPFFQFVKSVAIMSIYSASEASYSLLKEEKINIDLPGGLSTLEKDWYPFVMTFNIDEGFSSYIGKPVKLSILYNFGAFDYIKGASTYYNPASDYFNGFYGAYVAKGDGFVFGYKENGTPNYDQMALVPEYDMRILVLESLGCTAPVFEFEADRTYQVDSFLGYDHWDVIEATITTNSPQHKVRQNYQAYIQYGKPSNSTYEGIDFPVVQVKGKIYARYFPEKACSIFLYVIAPNEASLAQCDQDFLQKTQIKLK